MEPRRPRRYPPGTQPYDVLNGLRIGALAGAIVGAIVAAVVGLGVIWLVLAVAVVGGVVGYAWERREIRHRRV